VRVKKEALIDCIVKFVALMCQEASFLLMGRISEYVMAAENVSVEFHVKAVFQSDNFQFAKEWSRLINRSLQGRITHGISFL